MVPSSFRRIAHLCFINQFSKKWHWLASTASSGRVSDISKKLGFLRSIPQIGTCIGHLDSGDDQIIRISIFLMKWGCLGHWGHWGCWGHWGHWGSRGFKAWKNHYWGLQSHPGVWIHLYFYVLKKRILGRIMKFQIKFWHLFCWRLLRPANAIFLKTGGWNTNIRTSWSP